MLVPSGVGFKVVFDQAAKPRWPNSGFACPTSQLDTSIEAGVPRLCSGLRSCRCRLVISPVDTLETSTLRIVTEERVHVDEVAAADAVSMFRDLSARPIPRPLIAGTGRLRCRRCRSEARRDATLLSTLVSSLRAFQHSALASYDQTFRARLWSVDTDGRINNTRSGALTSAVPHQSRHPSSSIGHVWVTLSASSFSSAPMCPSPAWLAAHLNSSQYKNRPRMILIFTVAQ